MKLYMRTVGVVITVTLLITAGLLFHTGDNLNMASKVAGGAREATLHSYRIAQALKSLSSGYELAVNEYYSTVLDFPVYQRKATEHQAAIERELLTLEKLGTGDAKAVAEMKRAFSEMQVFRKAVETALSAKEKDWDGAREALFKLNLVSIYAIQQADTLSHIAEENAASLDQSWQMQQTQALSLLRSAMLAVLVAAMMVAMSAFWFSRSPD